MFIKRSLRIVATASLIAVIAFATVLVMAHPRAHAALNYLAVDAGGSGAGNFQADAYFSGGKTDSRANTIDTSGVDNPAPDEVYQTDRHGNASSQNGGFTYKLPGFNAGTYQVRLHFAELYWSNVGQRQFNVSINGVSVLTNFDIIQAAGGKNKAVVETFQTTVSPNDDQVTVAFTVGAADYPKVSGIEVQQQSLAAPTPPCKTNEYGTATDQANLVNALKNGSASDVATAIANAEATKGNEIGCPNAADTYTTADSTVPSLDTVANIWNTVHAPKLASYTQGCPYQGRDWASIALGGYYAKLAGYGADATALQSIADMQVATQYSTDNAPSPLTQTAGVYGYLNTNSSDPCYNQHPIGGSSNEGVVIAQNCQNYPSACVTYNNGLYAGDTLQVDDTQFGPTDYGGMGYNQGWAGVMMIEAALQTSDPNEAAKFKASALLAGQWALAEPPALDANYTAKDIWLLAELYDWTGDTQWRDGMMDKLRRDLEPSVLMDQNGDGIVDGTNQPFSGLTQIAQQPGRFWDSHNARATYMPMNAWAFTEAYVALRDRGDSDLAAEVRPYAIAMLNNIAWEVNNLGVPGSGPTQRPYALLLGLWKIASYEHEDHPDWAQAVWADWNNTSSAGNVQTYGDLYSTYGTNSFNAGLYLLYLSGTPYVPLAQR